MTLGRQQTTLTYPTTWNLKMYKCPSCGSSAVAKQAIAKRAGAAIGGVSGALRGLSATSIGASIVLITSGPTGGLTATIGRLASAITAAFVSGTAGCIAGAKIGTVIDHYVFDAYQCNQCNCSFRMHLPTTPLRLTTQSLVHASLLISQQRCRVPIEREKTNGSLC
jgi:hypothetical protein